MGATKVYCFVHKAPVCADCICFPEHRLCVIRTYSDWVIDGDYDWPPKCGACQNDLKDEDTITTRLGCLHNLHTSCLQSHLGNFPPHTAPAGFVCPSCPTAVWPPNKYFKESGSALYSNLKEVITQVSSAKVLLGSDAAVQSRETPLAFSTGPLAEISISDVGSSEGDGVPTAAAADASSSTVPNIVDSNHVNTSDVPLSTGANMAQDSGPTSKTTGPTFASTNINIISPDSRFSKSVSSNQSQPGATTRKHAIRVDRSQFENHEEHDDKYSKRGPAYRQFLKYVPFFSNGLPTLPITAADGEEAMDDRRRRRYRSSTMDVRKLILLFAIMSCMATAMLLYYRLSQSSGFSGDAESDEQ
uniref:RING-type domain-containing protein n=1 Tax=Physcomitrium patens TaxID=3218 RepID=A0A7I4AS43_PHYPA|nr:zinc finger protein-like 1 isoform X2 [Physcomitrium patens]|eukprot:XP_024393742.1 zinc finger protein-like 1 isoform X2 [Physcomitrella patens]